MAFDCPPRWQYNGPDTTKKQYRDGHDGTQFPDLTGEYVPDLGSYCRDQVSNLDSNDEGNHGRAYFNMGLRHMLSYQHELASKCFLAALHFAPRCALAHALLALCHSPNYNFKGDAYYESTHHPDEINSTDHMCVFPSQQLADRHSRIAVETVEEIRRMHRKGGKRGKKEKGKKQRAIDSGAPSDGPLDSSTNENAPTLVSDVETSLISAIRVLTCNPGVDSALADDLVGRPYADAMRKLHSRYPHDPEVAYFFAESLMVLNAWRLYEYPTGRPLSNDVVETRDVLELSLEKHHDHVGLCHLYVHLMEMSPDPDKALAYCGPLRYNFKMAGHLIHMPTHIDVLVGDYESCVRFNCRAIAADMFTMKSSPDTAGVNSFYFGYIVHNYHFAAYGAILGGMEAKAMEIAAELGKHLTEDLFTENPNLGAYLESYSALELHVMVRFGRWKDILEVELPRNKDIMFFRTATIAFSRGLAYANMGDIDKAKKCADQYDSMRKNPIAENRILHNNVVKNLLDVDAPMLRGEIAYHEGRYDDAFRMLRKAVELQDGLNYDEPWGKMQPIRHALGGLLLERNHLAEAADVFRTDLRFHPKNPFALVGLIQCLRRQVGSGLLEGEDREMRATEIQELVDVFEVQRRSEWADFDVQPFTVALQTKQGAHGDLLHDNITVVSEGKVATDSISKGFFMKAIMGDCFVRVPQQDATTRKVRSSGALLLQM